MIRLFCISLFVLILTNNSSAEVNFKPIHVSTDFDSLAIILIFAGKFNYVEYQKKPHNSETPFDPIAIDSAPIVGYVVAHHYECGSNTIGKAVGFRQDLVQYEHLFGTKKELSRAEGKEIIIDESLIPFWRQGVAKLSLINLTDGSRLAFMYNNSYKYAKSIIRSNGCQSQSVQQLQENLIRYYKNFPSLQEEYYANKYMNRDLLGACEAFKKSKKKGAEKILSCECLAKAIAHSDAQQKYQDMGDLTIIKFYYAAADSSVFPNAILCFKGGENYLDKRNKSLPQSFSFNSMMEDGYASWIQGYKEWGRKKYQSPKCEASWREFGQLIDSKDACELFEMTRFHEYRKTPWPEWTKVPHTKADKICELPHSWKRDLKYKCALSRYGVLTREEAKLGLLLSNQDRELYPESLHAKYRKQDCPNYSLEELDGYLSFIYSANTAALTPGYSETIAWFSNDSKVQRRREQCAIEYIERTFLN